MFKKRNGQNGIGEINFMNLKKIFTGLTKYFKTTMLMALILSPFSFTFLFLGI